MDLKISGKTDVGRKRDHNEDYFQVDESLGLVVVCDGMGGHLAGEVASEVACQTVVSHIQENSFVIDDFRNNPSLENRAEVEFYLVEAISLACEEVYRQANEDDSKKNMGTTLVLALVIDKMAFIVHVGDSRAYLIRKGQVQQLTDDHSMVNELVKQGVLAPELAEKHPQANIITRAIGIRKVVTPDTLFLELIEGDRILLCSDGLSGYTSDNDLEKLSASSPFDQLASNSIDFANKAGGKDNITSVVMEVGDDAGPPAHPEEIAVDKKIEVLKKIPLFKKLNFKELSLLLGIVHHQKVDALETIFQEGDTGQEMFILLSGEVEVLIKNQVVCQLKAGQYFGEMALIDKGERTASVRSLAAVKMLVLKRDDLLSLISQRPKMGVKLFWAILQTVNARLRSTDQKLEQLIGEGIDQDDKIDLEML